MHDAGVLVGVRLSDAHKLTQPPMNDEVARPATDTKRHPPAHASLILNPLQLNSTQCRSH
eukprot:CAMPEP_0185488920 /NCGR_PEP_ID=MMETSP1366-20130426/12774_1 /TAXON_ID=38817 /ORGANISM="Gephyrocapsa oceanica, Strain RCC1303" /LENGTH=59 /DNA_ID=CAMNT_0028097445 /DNA_START=13 /DNA_END=190 /DNA_ORIENTATION=-